MVAVACGTESNLGTGFQKDDIEVPPDDTVAFPIAVGSQYWYQFAKTYRRASGTGGGALTEGEKQAVGNVCVEVVDVANGYNANEESLVTGRVKVVGDSQGGDIVYTDQDDPTVTRDDPATATQVDGYLSVLWLHALTMPSSGHGYSSATDVTFRTQESLGPADQALNKLLFFDTRTSADNAWSGWQSSGDTEEAQRNYMNDLLTYFIDAFGLEFFTGSDFKESHLINPTTGYFSVEMTWREEAQVDWPEGLQGTVLHSFRADLNSEGSIRAITEFVTSDQPTLSFLQNCPSSGACAAGTLTLNDTLAWDQAYCKF